MRSGASCADVVAGVLAGLGVRMVFTVSGNQILGLMDALDRAGVRLVHCRHETAAVYMAEAAARVTGEPGVALVTAGPGHTSMLTGMLNAAASESPVVVLSGCAPTAQHGGGAFQEIDQQAIAAPIGWSASVADPADAAPLVREAWRRCQAPVPGPSCLSLPVDVLHGRAPSGDHASDEVSVGAPEPLVDSASVARVTGLLRSARSPLVLLRPSLARAESARAVARLRGRVVCLVLESPRGLADPAWDGLASAPLEADVVAVLGPIDFAAGFGQRWRGRSVVQVSSRQPELDAGSRHLGAGLTCVLTDERAFLHALADALHDPAIPGREQRAARPVSSPDHDLPLHPLEICDALRPLLRADDLLVIEGGEFGQWVRAGFADRLDQQLINGKLGAIGGAVPHAVGAAFAAPGRRVLAFTGDGAFGYYAAELETAAREGANVTVFVGNDACWGAERHAQVRMFGADRAVATTLSRCDYARVAEGYGAAGFSARAVEELDAAVAAVLSPDMVGGPRQPVACVDVAIRSVPSPAAGAV